MDTASADNIAPLNLNGGFEESTPEGETPIGWHFRNVVRRTAAGLDPNEDCGVDKELLSTQAVEPNFYRRFVAPQPFPGYRSFVQMTLGSPQPVDVRANLANLQYFQAYTPFGPIAGNGTSRAAYADDLRYTLGFSVEVLGGRGRIEVFTEWDDDGTLRQVNEAGEDLILPTNHPDLIATNVGVGPWRRFTFAGRFGTVIPDIPNGIFQMQGTAFMLGPTIRFTRVGSDPFVFRLTSVLVAPGNYAELAYPGDLSYYLDPRNIILISYGSRCPPGFRPVELTGRFVKFTTVPEDSGSEGGSPTHTHEIGEDLLNVSIQRTTRGNQNSSSIGSAPEHLHPAGPGLSLPSSRTVTLCVKY